MGHLGPHPWAVLHRRLFRHPARAGLPLVSSDAQRAREEAASWLILLDDDPDDQEQQTRFREWLVADPAHATAWASISRTSDLLASAPTPPARRVRPRPSFRFALTAAAGVALAACLLLTVSPTIFLKLRADDMTGTAEIRAVRLADGSSVRLGPQSAIAVSYADGKRTVALLAGEALFDVQHDPARPFQVTARGLTVTDLGTRFDVDMRGEATAVSVNHGHVRVDSGGQAFDLHPGDWLRLDPAGHAAKGAGLPNDLTAGPSARIAARNSPVAAVVDELRPWFAGRILVTDAGLGRRPVTGVFDAADPARALQALVGPAGGRVIRLTPWLLIVTSG